MILYGFVIFLYFKCRESFLVLFFSHGLSMGCHIKVPYAFIQPNGSWCWSNAGFMASLKGQGAGGITWLVISLGIRTIFQVHPSLFFVFNANLRIRIKVDSNIPIYLMFVLTTFRVEEGTHFFCFLIAAASQQHRRIAGGHTDGSSAHVYDASRIETCHRHLEKSGFVWGASPSNYK